MQLFSIYDLFNNAASGSDYIALNEPWPSKDKSEVLHT
jgi:hypothetical protein